MRAPGVLVGGGEQNRKQWIEHRLQELAEILTVSLGGFAVRDKYMQALVRLRLRDCLNPFLKEDVAVVISELLESIMQRPTMYITEPSLHCLKAFLDGWMMGQDDPSESSQFMIEFHEWIRAKYGVSTTQSWAQIITFYSVNQVNALDNALQLLAEFRATR